MDPILLNLLSELLLQYPHIAAVLLVVGILRIINKPIFALLHVIVQSTKTEKDNQALEKVEKSLLYKIFLFTLDWLASFKLPESEIKTTEKEK